MKKSIEEEIKQLNRIVRWILFFGAGALLLIPIFVTQFNWFIDFTRTGQIGDTLGGTTAPVIGAVSALLIYFSFRAQINANRIIQNQIDEQKKDEASKKNFEHQMERYRHLKDYIDNFKYNVKRVGFVKTETSSINNEVHGSEAIFLFLRKGVKTDRNLSEMRIIISFFSLILNNIIPIKENLDSKFIFNLVEIQFYRNIWDSNEKIITGKSENSHESEHELANICSKLRDIYDELTTYKEIWPN